MSGGVIRGLATKAPPALANSAGRMALQAAFEPKMADVVFKHHKGHSGLIIHAAVAQARCYAKANQ